MAKQIWTEEEKAGKKIADIMSDLRLDASRVGESLGSSQPVQLLNRLVNMIDGMYVSRERFRRALGETPTEINALPQIDDGDYDGDYATDFETRCSILSEIYLNYKEDTRFVKLIKYADIACPAAYMIDSGIVEPNRRLANFIDEAWDVLLDALALEDEGYYSLNDMVDSDEDVDYYEEDNDD